MEMLESLDMALLLDSENRPDFKHVSLKLSIMVLNCDFDHYPITQNTFHVDPFVIHTKWNELLFNSFSSAYSFLL